MFLGACAATGDEEHRAANSAQGVVEKQANVFVSGRALKANGEPYTEKLDFDLDLSSRGFGKWISSSTTPDEDGRFLCSLVLDVSETLDKEADFFLWTDRDAPRMSWDSVVYDPEHGRMAHARALLTEERAFRNDGSWIAWEIEMGEFQFSLPPKVGEVALSEASAPAAINVYAGEPILGGIRRADAPPPEVGDSDFEFFGARADLEPGQSVDLFCWSEEGLFTVEFSDTAGTAGIAHLDYLDRGQSLTLDLNVAPVLHVQLGPKRKGKSTRVLIMEAEGYEPPGPLGEGVEPRLQYDFRQRRALCALQLNNEPKRRALPELGSFVAEVYAAETGYTFANSLEFTLDRGGVTVLIIGR